jgi:hypothetical protein
MRTDQGTARVNAPTGVRKISIGGLSSGKFFPVRATGPCLGAAASQPPVLALTCDITPTVVDHVGARSSGEERNFVARFFRRVPAKLTYPAYSGVHTLVVGFLTVLTRC